MLNLRRSATLALGSVALAIVGCGDEGSTISSPASLAPPQSPLFLEANIRPTGVTKANVETVAQTLTGSRDLGSLIVAELEDSAGGDDGRLDFDGEVEPWLGKRAALFFQRYDGDDFEGFGVVLPSTDLNATQAFVDTRVEEGGRAIEESSYDGTEYWTNRDDGTAVGLIGESLVIAESERVFKASVDASAGDSLAGEDAFEDAISGAVDGSLADLYVDLGKVLRGREGGERQALSALEGAGLDSSEATAVASVIPGANRVEIELSSDLGGDQQAPSGNASELLGSLPADSLAAFAFSGFDEQLMEAIDSLDQTGAPPDLEPGELKSGLGQAGIDIEGIAASVQQGGVYASGSDEGSIGGALVLTMDDTGEVASSIAAIGRLVRQVGVPGVTALGGGVSGFSVSSPDLGPRPLVVATAGDRLAIGYGTGQTLRGLSPKGGASLSGAPDYQAAVAALDGAPIGGFVDGPAALRLADNLVSSSEGGFEQAKPYLQKIRFIAIGSVRNDGERSTAKLIVGLK
jgi:hypothetical protein